VAPRSGFVSVLWPVVDAFCRKYPGIQPDLHLDDQIGNWVHERADVGFRIGAPPEEGLIARKLFPVQLIICAAPAYLEQHGTPGSLDELLAHRCSVFRHPATGEVFPWYLKVDGEVVRRELPPALSTNDIEIELQAVLDGQVVAQLSSISAAPHIRAGRIVPLLAQHMTDHMSVTLFYGSRRTQPARVRHFIDFAVERLTDNPDYVLKKVELKAKP
jgi:DNA-binding transcriptional LysR family regulator